MTTRKRAFVFVTKIPDFLLEPLAVVTANNPRSRANRDPRYERLRALLASNSSGVMLVMHLETRGYALALYASEQEALAACKTTIVPVQSGHQHPPLLLRILQRERPAPLQAVYTPTLAVEGEVVQKAELADTRGLELVYRGRAVARWCPNTRAHEDCPFGTSCSWVHRREYQQTVRKRPRVELLAGVTHMTQEERDLMHRVTHSTRCAEERLVPQEMQLDFSLYVPITRDEARLLVEGMPTTTAKASITTTTTTATAAAADAFAALVQRVEAACAGHSGPYFVKFAFHGGAPWDWSLHDETEGLPHLRQRAPFPSSGAPTPLERDLFCQQVLYHVNQMNRFTTIASALRAFSASPGAQKALQQHLNETRESDVDYALELCVRPWLFLPTVGMEVTVLLEGGGELVRGVVQRHGSLRLMTSFAFLRKHRMDFSRYAVLGSDNDVDAEACLEAEMRGVTAAVRRGVETLRYHLRQRVAQQQLPSCATWCVQLAATTSPMDGVDASTMRCVVLSLKPYQATLEELTAMHGALRGSEVMWNTRKHAYVSLFSRELMERLQQQQQP